MRAELHYLYSLLLFSDAHAAADSMKYSGSTECGRLSYERDGIPWVLVIRKDDEGMRE
jgi:hypothetical protein